MTFALPILVVQQVLGQTPVAGPPALQWEWFPKDSPPLAPYLSALNLYGDKCLQPGSLIETDPMSGAAQYVKKQLASVGLTYRLNQSYSFIAMSNVSRGDNVLNFYNTQLLANWVVFNTAEMGGTAGWVGFEMDAGVGLGFDAEVQSPQQNIGAAAWPNFGWIAGSSAWIAQLSWAQSFFNGSLIVQAGMIDPTLYVDANSYANNQYTQLMNWAFVNSQVLPYSFGSLGAVIQWQPCDWFYAMFATGANNTPNGRPPWFDVSSGNWSYIWELGIVSKDTFGLGPGTYRLQPFWAEYQGDQGGGICLNVEQRLGKDGHLGFFGRFGIGDEDVTRVNGAAAQVALGLAVSAPNITGLVKDAGDYLAAGFVWTQAPDRATVHTDEFGVEFTYNMPITPTLSLQPDLQVLWDPAYGPSTTNVVFQLQAVLTW